MIGVGCRVMRLINYFCRVQFVQVCICFGLCILSLQSYIAQAASSATVTVTATFVAATCDISVPSTYWLGTLTPGAAKKHSSLRINWTCDGGLPVKTALIATPISGIPNSTKDKLEMMVSGVQNGTLLWLEENTTGRSIKLSGDEADAFCSGEETGSRVCDLTPVTEVHASDKFGIANAIIRFEIIYQ